MKKKRIEIEFTEETTGFILEALNYSVDKEEYIIDSEGKRVLDIFYNEEVKIEDLGGFYKKGVVKGDLSSIMQLSEDIKK